MVTETGISKVLLIGSCMAQANLGQFRALAPSVRFDSIMFNNVMDLPSIDETRLRSYNFQYIQLSLREIVSDRIVDFQGFLAKGAAEEIYSSARQMLGLILDAALKHNKTHGILTFVANFMVPQAPVVAPLSQIGSSSDFAAV